ncbi:MAG: glutamate 5-kinase [Alphaproteobacteria bacterium]|nr:glutamate 5-kinase [Alphaproteobacteria bacterium]NCQ88000.1 glutamate 5-kinase [Alphaproteobacteria bacterium]NCT05493.1 glutamate 5-kinase [Alphaproteobacteria bacterium]
MTPSETTNNTLINESNRIVIKIGSALVTDEKTGKAKQNWLNCVAADISYLKSIGKEVVIVSSGAIALGRNALGIDYTNRPSSIPLEQKQAAAALGNVEMTRAYAQAFAPFNHQIALILLSPKDTEVRNSHLNARATINTLLIKGKVPVINENDTVSTAEIRFGDNDRLAARVAQMIGADLLIQLSTTDGLYTADPTQDDSAQHIPVVEDYSDDLLKMAGDAPAGLSTGGMKSKLEAARIATMAGVTMMIASGKIDNPLKALLSGAKATVFKAADKPLTARKKWISSHVKAQGALIIDEGAAQALHTGKSLLPAGVAKVEGDFIMGDAVAIRDMDGHTLAIGLMNYSANESRLILGHKSADISDVLGYSRGDTLIHRDDLVLQA